ncbi:MAG: redoxin domain-containing protein [Chloroflexota bacterium]
MIRPSFSSWTLFSIGLLLAGAAWTWASRADPADVTGGAIPAPQTGFLAPEFTLNDLDGQPVELAGLRGKAVLVNVWASWCGPCRAEMPAMQRVYQDYRERGLVILGVNAANQDNPDQARSFIAEQGLTFPILLDERGQVSELYAVRSLPTSFFIDPQGMIQEVIIGGPMSEALLRIRVEALLPAEEPR